MLTVGLIVEGHGEVRAVPILIRRLVGTVRSHLQLKFEVRRIPKSQLLQPSELERAVEALVRQIGRTQPILVLIDADDDCPAALAGQLKARCRISHSDLIVSIVIANREYEAWFLAALTSLAYKTGVNRQIKPVDNPESVRGAKERLASLLLGGQGYSETRHQERFSAIMDLNEAMAARSFRKLEKEIRAIL